ncbi:MAG: primosomal protein N', partial [Lachnospiraceae bacterium]|nr:primosomal protein N' [Lachnospiraceae bacterium]
MVHGSLYADVIIDISIEKLDIPFTYRIPERLSGIICVGSRVRIPFGKGDSEKKGYVTAIKDTADYDDSKIKDILGLVDGSISAEERSFEIAAFIKDTYGGTLSQALKAVIPVKSKVKAVEHKTLVRKMPVEELKSLADEAFRQKRSAKERLLRALIEDDRIPVSFVTKQLNV